MAKPFYFWQTVSKRPKFADLAIKKTKWQPWNIVSNNYRDKSHYYLRKMFTWPMVDFINILQEALVPILFILGPKNYKAKL